MCLFTTTECHYCLAVVWNLPLFLTSLKQQDTVGTFSLVGEALASWWFICLPLSLLVIASYIIAFLQCECCLSHIIPFSLSFYLPYKSIYWEVICILLDINLHGVRAIIVLWQPYRWIFFNKKSYHHFLFNFVCLKLLDITRISCVLQSYVCSCSKYLEGMQD